MLLAASALPFLWTGCAVAPRFPAGAAILAGETYKLPPAPDSLRAELELTAFSGGRKTSVSAALSAKPRRDYKLDLYGLPGMLGGSFLWTRGQWTLVLFDREAYAEGAGEHVEMGNLGLREVSVHDLFSCLWGDFFPGDAPVDSLAAELPRDLHPLGGGSFGYAGVAGDADNAGKSLPWQVRLDAHTGLVTEALREDSAFRIEYSDYRAERKGGGGRPVPGKMRLYRYRDAVLEIKVKSLEVNPHWRRDPFFIKVPKGFSRLQRP
ncbi:MAG: hypothetical protein ABIY63_06480 [Fibrobacteria bacterium]